jgi:hypothetical protein
MRFVEIKTPKPAFGRIGKQPASGQWMRTLAIVTTDEAGGHFKTVRR